MSDKPEALRLAGELVETPFQSTRYIAAAELRRLHESEPGTAGGAGSALRMSTVG